MIDPYGRPIKYIRVSVTDRCDLRCVYCMAEEMTFLPKAEVLSLEELDRLCHVFIDQGVEKIRITGGEPLVRKNVLSLFHSVGKRLGQGLSELTVTTNGTRLAEHAQGLWDAGVRRINVSLDTLDPQRFKTLTRRGDFHKVMAGIDAAEKVGLAIKINAVALRGLNDDEIPALVRWCGTRGFDLTFIETMPLGEVAEDRTAHFMPLSEVEAAIAKLGTVLDTPHHTPGPARYKRLVESGQRLGFITPLSHNFCDTCNRVRLTCTGQLFMCLGQDDSADLRAVLRHHPDDNAPLVAAIAEAIARKPKSHDFRIGATVAGGVSGQVARHMSVTGG